MKPLTYLKALFIAIDRWIFIRLVILTGFFVGFLGWTFCGYAFKCLACIPGLRILAVPLWRRVLLRAGYKIKATEWTGWVETSWPSMKHKILHARTLLDARRFEEIPEMLHAAKRALPKTSKNGRYYTNIVDIEAMLAIECSTIIPDAAYFAKARGSEIVDYCYQRAWDAHSVLDSRGVRRFLAYYVRAINYEPDLFFYVCDALMEPNGLWEDIVEGLNRVGQRIDSEVDVDDMRAVDGGISWKNLESVTRMMSGRKKIDDWRSGVQLRLARAYLETGRFQHARELLGHQNIPSGRKYHLNGLLCLYEPRNVDAALGRTYLSLAYADKKAAKSVRSEIAGELAMSFEEEKNYESARQYYVSSFYVGGTPFFLPDYLWRYVSFCMAKDDYSEASYVMRNALRILWGGFRRLARKKIERRLQLNQLIPKSGAFFLGCWGIGDDIIRVAMFDALTENSDHVGCFGFSVDPRMVSLYSRSFPEIEFIPVSRQSGPFAVSELEYVKLRDGIPPNLDRGRLDQNVLKAARRYPDVALTEDIMVAFIDAGPGVKRKQGALLSVLPEKVKLARSWLNSLGPGLNVGISWRSGQRNLMRDKSYTDLVRDWGSVLSLNGINFINLQYSWDPDELQEAEVKHGCQIYMMPEVDLKNDIEDIVALASVLDVVIAPGTAVREMCAAVGANVWTLSTTPVLPDLWRLQPENADDRDRLFPNMIHFTAFKYGDANGALAEIANRLTALAGQHMRDNKSVAA